jgi:hypothetical protein
MRIAVHGQVDNRFGVVILPAETYVSSCRG